MAKARWSAVWWATMALVLALVIVGPGFDARLGATDDHEISVIARQLSDHPAPEVMALHAMNDPGRFRPGYWVMRVGETAIWGESVRGWYVDRLLLLAATLLGVFALARGWLRPWPSLLTALLVVAGSQAEAFYRLGPQEAYAMPMAVWGFVLIGSRRAWAGLGLLALAAFTKEPFAVLPLVGAAWAFRLGDRRPAVVGVVVAGVALAGIGLAVLRNGGDYYSAQGLSVPLTAGRYLYPWVLGLALGVGFAVARWRWLAVPVVALIVLNLGVARINATAWAGDARAFAAFVDELRADPRPFVLVLDRAADAEPAWAIRGYLPDHQMAWRGPDPLPGFAASVPAGCLEVDVDVPPAGVCPEAVEVP